MRKMTASSTTAFRGRVMLNYLHLPAALGVLLRVAFTRVAVAQSAVAAVVYAAKHAHTPLLATRQPAD